MADTPQKPPALHAFSAATRHDDGTVSFRLDRRDGRQLAVSCPIPDLPDIINYFCQFARQVSEEEAIELPRGGQLHLVPMQVDDIGIGTALDPDHTVFVARLGGFHLALAVPNSKLAEFGPALAATVTTLSASRDQKN